MKIRLYTDDEIDQLNKSIFIRSVKYKRELEYEPIFKLWTIVLKHDCPELTAREIFARGGIDTNIIHKKLPQRRIKEWIDNYKKFGLAYFLPEDEFYKSIIHTQNKDKTEDDKLKSQLMEFVLNRLKDIKNEEVR